MLKAEAPLRKELKPKIYIADKFCTKGVVSLIDSAMGEI